jgi:cell wall assembly regulator SMI1
MTLDAFLEHIKNKKPSATDVEIVRFEHSLGITLPADYRSFLQRCNGGYAGGSVWDFDNGIGVHHIAGFREEKHFSLPWRCNSLREFLPPDVIPIADDPFGNAICLGIRSQGFGKIFFWDHESANDELARVADSFTQFVERLRSRNQEKG